MRIVKHTAILTTTINRSHNETTANSDISFINKCVEVCILISVWIFYLTSTGTEYEAYVNGTVATIVLHTLSSNLNRTYLSTADHNGTGTSVCLKSLRFTTKTFIMSRMSLRQWISFCNSSNGALKTTAIDTIIDVAAGHGNTGISQHICFTTATIDATTNCNLLSTFSYSIKGCVTSPLRTDKDLCVTSNFSLFTTTKYITCNMSTENGLIIIISDGYNIS